MYSAKLIKQGSSAFKARQRSRFVSVQGSSDKAGENSETKTGLLYFEFPEDKSKKVISL